MTQMEKQLTPRKVFYKPKKLLRVTGLILLIVVVLLLVTIQFRQHRSFDAPLPPITASTDTNIIKRGKELVFGAAHCVNCHASPGGNNGSTASTVPLLSGGMKFELPLGDIFAPNLTPDATGI